MQGNFSYHNPTKLYFGDESLNYLKDELKNFGPVVLLNYGSGSGEEMGWVEKFTERILDLGGDVKFEGMKSRDLICDPIEYVKADLAIQEPGVELLMKCMEGVKDDPTTYDLLKDYLKDEEEDLYWSQGAVELIEKIGTQNWLLLQL